MFKVIIRGFTSNKAGKLFLISSLFLIFSNILFISDSSFYIVNLIFNIIFIIAVIYYSIFLKIKIWIMILLVGLLFLPVEMGGALSTWFVFFYFAGKNYTNYSTEG